MSKDIFFPGTLTVHTDDKGVYQTKFNHPKTGIEQNEFLSIHTLNGYLKGVAFAVEVYQEEQQKKDLEKSFDKAPYWSKL